jgi:hypothetical protein
MHRMRAKLQILVAAGVVWGKDLEREFAERWFIPRVVDVESHSRESPVKSQQ